MGAVADDDTGMTDLCGMFAKHGVNAVMFFETQSRGHIEEYSKKAEVVAIGTRSRTINPDEAYRKTKEALVALRTLDPVTFYLKYCSTFDSTTKGNIGQMIDAGLDLLGDYTVAVPALPINGRTTYMGNHFVSGIRLDRSSMRNHPLTPMTEADLVLWLGQQTKRKVGLAPYEVVKKGAEALKKRLEQLSGNGTEIVVVDCITQRNLKTIDEASLDLGLITGSSGLAMELPPIWKKKGIFHRSHQDLSDLKPKKGIEPILVIAGSASAATRAQNRFAIEHGFVGIRFDTASLFVLGRTCDSEMTSRVSVEAIQSLSEGKNVVVYSALDEEDVDKTKNVGHSLGFTDSEIGNRISEGNGQIAANVLQQIGLNKLVIAGGETAGAVGRRLRLVGLNVGKEISPGVPICFAISEDSCLDGLVLALKSGNFGRPTFYRDAYMQMRRYLSRWQ